MPEPVKKAWQVVAFIECTTYVRADTEEEAYRLALPVEVPGYDINDITIEAKENKEE